MATSVSQSSTAGAQFTWATATFAWDSIDGTSKTWGSANVMDNGVSIGETLDFVEEVQKSPTVRQFEAFTLSEALVRGIGLNEDEALVIAEGLGKAMSESIAETFSIASSYSNGFGLIEQESFAITDDDAIRRDFGLRPEEAINILEQYGDLIAFILGFSESFSISDELANSVGKGLSESFAIAEALQRAFGLRPEESVALVESLGSAFSKPMSESVGIADDIAKTPGLDVGETFSVQEQLAQDQEKAIAEVIALVEVFGRAGAFQRAIAEGFSVSDSIAKAMSIPKSEAFQIFDEYRRRANGVISDMIISSADMTLAEFASAVDNGHAPGYESFRDFVPGDYQYQEAIFRAVLESSTSDRARLTDLTLTVDVPDMNDRGSVTISAGQAATGVRVNFNRGFHVVPEITTATKSGTVFAIAKAINPDVTGFTMIMEDVNGNRVAGTATWAAHGY